MTRAAILGLLALAPPSAAVAPPFPASGPAGKTVPVELYTSQGCESCPAADELVEVVR